MQLPDYLEGILDYNSRQGVKILWTELFEKPFFIGLLVSWTLHEWMPWPKYTVPILTGIVTLVWTIRTDHDISTE